MGLIIKFVPLRGKSTQQGRALTVCTRAQQLTRLACLSHKSGRRTIVHRLCYRHYMHQDRARPGSSVKVKHVASLSGQKTWCPASRAVIGEDVESLAAWHSLRYLVWKDLSAYTESVTFPIDTDTTTAARPSTEPYRFQSLKYGQEQHFAARDYFSGPFTPERKDEPLRLLVTPPLIVIWRTIFVG
ncbi:hypothetical protein DPSP01_004385 [Paraphaeosphaeria sporulosa]